MYLTLSRGPRNEPAITIPTVERKKRGIKKKIRERESISKSLSNAILDPCRDIEIQRGNWRRIDVAAEINDVTTM